MVLIFLRLLIVFNVSSFEFHQVELLWLHRQWWVVCPIHLTSVHCIIRFGGMLESYSKLQPKLKQFPSLQKHFSWFGLPCRRKSLTILWNSTASNCRRVSANGGNFEHIMWLICITDRPTNCYVWLNVIWCDLFLTKKNHEFHNKLNWILKIWGVLPVKMIHFTQIFR